MKEIKILITETNQETSYMMEVFIDKHWFKELGPFHDPQLALEQTAKNEDLKTIMRPDLYLSANYCTHPDCHVYFSEDHAYCPKHR